MPQRSPLPGKDPAAPGILTGSLICAGFTSALSVHRQSATRQSRSNRTGYRSGRLLESHSISWKETRDAELLELEGIPALAVHTRRECRSSCGSASRSVAEPAAKRD